MMDAAATRRVRHRAADICEYCHLPESAFDIPFHIEHVRARQHRGDDSPDNFCLACDRCNLYKGPNLAGIDPETDEITPLFHPRRQDWSEHFAVADCEVHGLTPCGRATVSLLKMNDPPRTRLRMQLSRGDDLD